MTIGPRQTKEVNFVKFNKYKLNFFFSWEGIFLFFFFLINMGLDPQLGSSSAERALGVWGNSKMSMTHPRYPALSWEADGRDYPCLPSTLRPSIPGSPVEERCSQMATNARCLGLDQWPYEERLRVWDSLSLEKRELQKVPLPASLKSTKEHGNKLKQGSLSLDVRKFFHPEGGEAFELAAQRSCVRQSFQTQQTG